MIFWYQICPVTLCCLLSMILAVWCVLMLILVILCNTLSHCTLYCLTCSVRRSVHLCVWSWFLSLSCHLVFTLWALIAVCVVICNVQPQARSFPQSIKFILAVWVVHIFTTSEPIFFTMPQVLKTPNWFLM